MKVYIIHIDLLRDIHKPIKELTDQEVIDLCAKDEDREYHDVYESVEELSAFWNTEEVFHPTSSYMRVIKDNEPEYVWVFTAEQVWDYETADIIVKAFATEEAAHKFMHDFIHNDKDESIVDYVKRKEWEVEHDKPYLYRAYEDGSYASNHIECTITKCEIKK